MEIERINILSDHKMEFLKTIHQWCGILSASSSIGTIVYDDYRYLNKFLKTNELQYNTEDRIIFNRLRQHYIDNK